jgi:ABC-type polysaccharide/polyol phosphate transport system ATPase subunit
MDDDFDEDDDDVDAGAPRQSETLDTPQRDWAIADVSLKAMPGRPLGVVGRAGAGKTTLVRLLAGLVPLTAGRAVMYGRRSVPSELASTFMASTRSPAANARTIVRLAGVPSSERERTARAAMELAFPARGHRGLSVKKQLSRLATAMAFDPYADVLLIDDPEFLGDKAFEERCLERLSQAVDRGAAVLLATKDADLVGRFCVDAVWLDEGRIALDGEVPLVLASFSAAASGAGPVDGHKPAGTMFDVPLSGFDANVALLSVQAGRPGENRHRFAAGEDVVITVRLETAQPSTQLQCVLRVRGDEGWARQFPQPKPLLELEVGVHLVTARLPGKMIPSGELVVDAVAKIRHPRRSVVGRLRALVLEIDEPDDASRELAAEVIGDLPELDMSDDVVSSRAVEWTVVPEVR